MSCGRSPEKPAQAVASQRDSSPFGTRKTHCSQLKVRKEFRQGKKKKSLFVLASGGSTRAETPVRTRSRKESQACCSICMTRQLCCQLLLPPRAFVCFFHLLQLVLIRAESWNCLTAESHCVRHSDAQTANYACGDYWDTQGIVSGNNTSQPTKNFLFTRIYTHVDIFIYILKSSCLVVAPQAGIQIWRKFSRICRRAAQLTGFSVKCSWR